MSDKEFPSCAYDVCAEFDCEETMALALIATRNELERTCKALDVAKDVFNWIDETYHTGQDMEAEIWGKVQLAEQEITALEQKDAK